MDYFTFFMIQKIFTNQRTDDYADGHNSTPEIMLIPLNHMECRFSHTLDLVLVS